MNWKKMNRWLLPTLIVLILLVMQATMLVAAKPAAAPLAVTDTPTQQVVITDTPVRATPHPKKTNTPQVYYPPDYRPRPGGPGNLGTFLLGGLLLIGGLAIVAVLWFIPRWNRRKG